MHSDFFVNYELEVLAPLERESIVNDLRGSMHPPLLVLNTCQRLECFGSAMPPDDARVKVVQKRDMVDAFERIVRIAAGLESRVPGELEILGQVRTAYKTFRESCKGSHAKLDRMFQDALSLARQVRRDSGIDSNVTSLGALASREILKRIPDHAPLAIVGSGSLAESVTRYLCNRGSSPVRIASRCPENAMELAQKFGAYSTGLDQLAYLFDDVAGIVTATAAPHTVVFEHHLEKARRPLVIVDLGAPADCAPEVQQMKDVTYLSLADIESKARINTEERRESAEMASRLVHEGAIAWASRLTTRRAVLSIAGAT